MTNRDRPSMPQGYGIASSDAGGMLEWSAIETKLTESRNYWIVTTGSDARPHATPVWGLWLDHAFFFSTDPSSMKGRNIARNPAIVVHLESGDDVVILEGAAERVTDPAVLARFADAYDVKYNIRLDTNDPNFGFYTLRLKVAMAWLEADFPTTATRWRFNS
jgi:general stress protein 26